MTVLGQEVKIGSPCRFIKNQGCSIYAAGRPSGCVTFQCAWLEDESVPDWAKPEASGILIAAIPATDRQYLIIVPAGSQITAEYRQWALDYAGRRKLKLIEERTTQPV